MKKLQNRHGETLIETLTALLIATLVCLFLATAIVTGSRVNAKVREADVSFQYAADGAAGNLTLTVTGNGGTPVSETINVQEFTTPSETTGEKQYRYYTYKK